MSDAEHVKPLLVGESNPYGSDPYFALYPAPDGCAGERLCRLVMGLRRKTYLKTFDRVNLVAGTWSQKRADAEASRIAATVARRPRPAVLLFGAKVARSFGVDYGLAPDIVRETTAGATYAVFPHPSGRNRRWNSPQIIPECRIVLRHLLPDVPFGEIDQKE